MHEVDSLIVTFRLPILVAYCGLNALSAVAHLRLLALSLTYSPISVERDRGYDLIAEFMASSDYAI